MTLDELIVRLRIEEDNHKSFQKTKDKSFEAKANMVEAGQKKGKKRKHNDEGASDGKPS